VNTMLSLIVVQVPNVLASQKRSASAEASDSWPAHRHSAKSSSYPIRDHFAEFLAHHRQSNRHIRNECQLGGAVTAPAFYRYDRCVAIG
jgi:hypothetical protein